MTNFDQQETKQRLQRIEELVQSLERSSSTAGGTGDTNLRAVALELMQSLMTLHGAGIERMLEIVFDSGPNGNALIDRLAEDSLVAQLLLLYDLHPADFETRVQRALTDVRPHLQGHGGNVELLSLADGVVRLRLQGNCHGCSSSQETLRQLIAQAIDEAAPDARAIEVEGFTTDTGTSVIAPMAANGLVQLQGVPLR